MYLRAVLEGVVYSLAHAWRMMSTPDASRVHEIVATGGGAQSTVWIQMIADVFQLPVRIVNDPGAAVGAALLGAQAIGEPCLPVSASHRSAQIFIDPHAQSHYPELADNYMSWAQALDKLWRSNPGTL